MSRFNELHLAAVLEEIASAMRLDAPVADSMNRLSERRLGGVSLLARNVRVRLNAGSTLEDAIQLSDSPLLSQASAAVKASQASGDPTLVSSLATQLRVRHENARYARLNWLYPVLLTFIAYIVAAGVMAPLVRANNTDQAVQWPPIVVTLADWVGVNGWIPLVVFASVAVGLLIFSLVRTRIPQALRRHLFCQSLADQIQADIPDKDAMSAACLMSGMVNDSETASTLDHPLVQEMVGDGADELPSMDSPDGKEVLVAKLRYAAAIHSNRLQRQDYLWGRLLPRVLMVLVGGGTAFTYVWWILRPIYQQVAQW